MFSEFIGFKCEFLGESEMQYNLTGKHYLLLQSIKTIKLLGIS